MSGRYDMSTKFLLELKQHEGYRRNPYRDTKGKWTGGYGHLMLLKDHDDFNENWSDDWKDSYWAEHFLNDVISATEDIVALVQELDTRPTASCQEVLINMRFNLGDAGLRKFKGMLGALSDGNVSKAADEMIDSKWHRDFVKWSRLGDVPTLRSRELETKMRNSNGPN